MKWLDRLAENSARALARRTSRRSMLAGLGSFLLGAATLPLLPVARGAATPKGGAAGVPAQGAGASAPPDTARSADPGDASSCDYWRHCAIDGFLCACCGGSQSICPPGTDMSAITWIGTCHNPADGTDYVISYNDCCGKSACGRCFCNRNEGDSALFQAGKSNDYNWCSGNSKANIPYHCSTARIVGAAK
ncbi:MAG TPA: methylamine dehydrogenase light chain [Steroidobacteraceae bacterium]|nr:methylamine dehydrogenase light chain [Steroidobacteraceae bacterium]